ncbi:tyrosine-type recombinase/integrase [Siccirubricoccus phaeus]|uniref:tyrosine-type recombinase/integrase n=1 Tax=Siccirubricoccus phaeus TaxID=2595053 RepID=UPI0011F1036C|nr:site-specific integrase [Siccirubricoccus phaeus]
MRLTDRSVAALRCPEGKAEIRVADDALPGFMARLKAGGVPLFMFQYRYGGGIRRVTLGRFGEMTTAKARGEAEKLRGLVRAGGDPWGERKRLAAATVTAEREARINAEADSFTVKALIDLYAEKHVASLRPATRRDVLSRLRLHLGPITARPATAIGRREAADVLDKAAEAGETTARRVRDYARAMWSWALRRGSLPEGTANPWEAAPAPGRDVARERTLAAGEIGAVWRAAEDLEPPYGSLVRFLMLTLARREEVTAMAWGEVAPDLSVWIQPGTRTKNGKAHVVHLGEPARGILREMLGAEADKPLPPLPKADRLVFGVPGNKAISSHSWIKRKLDLAIARARLKAAAEAGDPPPEPVPGWVLHDFRRSGVTWLASAGFPPHVADRLLNHVQGTIKGVAAIYQRGEFLEERKAALEAWGTHVLACGEGGEKAANVADLAAHRGRKALRA